MFAFLHKKIPISNNVKINAVSWSHEYNYIAIGGEDRRIYMIKADTVASARAGQSSGKSYNIVQSLEGHGSMITICQWNEVFQKLTTCDNRGMIIMWSQVNNNWVEYMVNERANFTCPVVSVDWSPDGHMICILYDDGYMIVGAVDGTRLWDVKLEAIGLRVQWSPDSKLILIAIKSSKPTVLIFDDRGSRLQNFKINLTALESSSVSLIVSLHWNSFYSNIGHVTANANLIIALSNGRVQLMRNESDPSPIVIDTEMTIYCTAWNHTGSVVAIAGRSESKGNLIKFLSPTGDCMQTLRLPGKKLIALSWDKEGLRLAVAIDNHLLIAAIKPHYEWAFFGDTIVYTLSKCVSETATLGDSIDDSFDPALTDVDSSTVIFYNFKSKTRRMKHLKKLLCIAASNHHCVIAVKCDSMSSSCRTLDGPSSDASTLILCNSLGTATEKRVIECTATCICMTQSLVIVASKDTLKTWFYSSFNSTSERGNSDDGFNLMSTASTGVSSDDSVSGKEESISVTIGHTIRCMRSSEKNLCVGLQKGEIIIYSLPKVTHIHCIKLDKCIPAFVSLDCDSSKVAVIDSTSTLTMYDLEGEGSESKQIETFKRKDVWSFMWSADEANTFAFTERNKLLLFQEMEPEETVHATGYICSFNGYEVKTIDLDCLINTPSDEGDIESFVSTLETRVLSEIKSLVKKENVKEGFTKAIEIADAHNSDKLWKLIAEEALKALAFEEAELALIRCKDYVGIQFLKRLSKLQSDLLKRAEVTAYFGDIDTAEAIFLQADRRDLAIELRQKMWQPLEVLRLIQSDTAVATVTDAQVKQAMCDAGDYWVDRMNWSAAIRYYEQSDNLEKVIDAYSATEQYEQLASLMRQHKFSKQGYLKAAHAFLSVGMCEDAVNAFVAIDHITQAIDACVVFNEWQLALKLAQENNMDEIDDLLAQYASHLLSEKKYFDIIELYRKANRIHDAANMVLKLIEDVKRQNHSNYSPLLMKQLYTLIGMLYSSEKKSLSERRQRSDATFVRKNTLTSLLREDESLIAAAAIFRAVDRPWRGAEAFHYYILSHKHLYDGNVDCAMRAAYYLLDYDDLLGAEPVFSLLALTACANRSFALCSRALLRLETLETLDDTQRDAYQSLAISIFSQFSPKESKNVPKAECTHCETLIPDYLNVCPSCNTSFKICTATAKPIMDPSLAWTCKRCQHSAFKAHINSLDYCPLCHEAIV